MLVAIVLISHVNIWFQKIIKKAKDTHNIPKYEMTRLVRMKHNQERIDVLGLKHLSTSLKDSSQPNCANGEKKWS